MALQRARTLIEHGEYEKARKVLKRLNDPQAQEWLAKLDDPFYIASLKVTSPSTTTPDFAAKSKRQATGCLILLIALVLLTLGVLGSNKTPAIAPTSTVTPTPSITLTPTITLTPSVTFTPSITLTPSLTFTPSPVPTDTQTSTFTLTPGNETATKQQRSANSTNTAQVIGITNTYRSISASNTAEQVQGSQTARMDNLTNTAVGIQASQTARMDNLTGTAEGIQASQTAIAQYQPIDSKELVSYADKHRGETVKVSGTVFKINDSQHFQMYLAGTFDAIIVESPTRFDNVYEQTYVTVYAVVQGNQSGQNAFGATITEPYIIADIIMVNGKTVN